MLIFLSAEAQAGMYEAYLAFESISNTDYENAVIGETQLYAIVTDIENQVLFTFGNAGPEASSITDVYFDDGSLFGIAGLIDADDGTGGNHGVDFTQSATPGDLPAGNEIEPPFVTTAGFSADSDPPAEPWGVNPGETLGILFDLQGGKTIQDVLGNGIDDFGELGAGTLRIGLHVQGFANGGSESFVNTTTFDVTVVPLPGAVILGLLGLCMAGIKLRRFA